MTDTLTATVDTSAIRRISTDPILHIPAKEL